MKLTRTIKLNILENEVLPTIQAYTQAYMVEVIDLYIIKS